MELESRQPGFKTRGQAVKKIPNYKINNDPIACSPGEEGIILDKNHG
jgi:hypothetical protein